MDEVWIIEQYDPEGYDRGGPYAVCFFDTKEEAQKVADKWMSEREPCEQCGAFHEKYDVRKLPRSTKEMYT